MAIFLILFLALGTLLSAGCSSSKISREPQYAPAADLLDILKDFQRLSRVDLYRFPIPKDVTGTNIMKATLVRLEDYERKNPGQLSDLIQFSKATAYERLREYDQAAAHYRKVAESNGRLGVEAARRMEAIDSFQMILQKALPSEDPVEYTRALDEKVEAWNELVRKYQETPYEALARIEEERLDRAKVTFVEVNRFRIRGGNEMVILAYTQLITKHRQSKNVYRHLLDFADFYMLLAKEYAAQNDPEGLSFNPDAFETLAKGALRFYTEVAQVDGILEKIEAQGKLEALRGFAERMRRLSR
ncbi:MAG: hypothetical protein HY695_25725 [Deltaproteobacteria bacterium]|nr:hypothetical protein [Deltaproteobacteria bacterium]